MTERFVAHVSKVRICGLILGMVVAVAAGFWIIANAEELAHRKGFDSPALSFLIGGSAILVFGAFTVVGVRQLFRAGPVMEIDSRGILWRRWSDQVIPWSAIVRVEQQAFQSNKLLCLWLDAPERYPGRSTLGKLASLSKLMGSGDVTLNMAGTDQSFDRLVEVVDAHLAARDRSGSGRS